jgi:hypothetical protein
MWPLKHPTVYRASRANRVGAVVTWVVAAASLFAWFVHKHFVFMAILPGRDLDDLPLRILWIVFIMMSVFVPFIGESITIGPEDVVLRGPFQRTRIRQCDIAGRRIERSGMAHFDVIVSRVRPDLTIQIPADIARDTAFAMWLRALPDLDH